MNKKDYSSQEVAIQAVVAQRSVLTSLITQTKCGIKKFCKQIQMSTRTFYKIAKGKFVTDESWLKLLGASCQVLSKEEFLKFITEYSNLFYDAFADR